MNNIKNARLQTGLTQEQVAIKLNTSRAAVSMYENGKLEANYNILKRLASLYKVTIDYLLDNTDNLASTQQLMALNQAKEVFLQSLKPVEKQIIDNMLILSEFKKYQLLGYMENLAKA